MFRRRALFISGWISSPTNVYGVANFGNTPTVFRTTGDGAWDSETSPMVSLRSISGSGANHVFAAGGPPVFFSAGQGGWTAQLTVEGDALNGVWVADRNTVYACSTRGLFFRSNGDGGWSEGRAIVSTGAAPALLRDLGREPGRRLPRDQ